MRSVKVLREIMRNKLKEKTNWGKNEILRVLDESIIEWLEGD